MQIPRSVKKEGEEGRRRRWMPLQPMVRWQAVPLQPMEVSGGADAHLQAVEDPTQEQVDTPKEGHDSMGKPMLEQSVPEGLHTVERTHAGAVCEELQPVGRTHVGEVRGGLSPVGGTPRWSRGRV